MAYPQTGLSSDHYDVICAGGSLSSFLSAALLSKVGHRVLLVDDSESGHSQFSDSLTFGGVSGQSAFAKILQELGIEKKFRPIDVLTQVLTPQHRIIFRSDASLIAKEFTREFGQESSSMQEFFSLLYHARDEIPGFIEDARSINQCSSNELRNLKNFWGRYYRPVRRSKFSRLQSVFDDQSSIGETLGAAILGALSYTTPSNIGFEQAARSLPLLLTGQYHFPGGVEALKDHLANMIRNNGSVVRQEAYVQALVMQRKKVTGVLLSSYEGVCKSEIIILGGSLRNLYLTVPIELRETSVSRALNRVYPSHWRFSISIKVEKSAIPVGSTPNMVLLGSSSSAFEEDNFLRIQLFDVDDRYTKILLTSLVPYRASSMDYEYLRRLAGKMLQALCQIMPFIHESIVELQPDFRKNMLELRAFYPFKRASWVPETLLQYYVRGHREVQDFWGPSWTTPHSNLYFAGRSVWPSLGLYGEALAAKKICDDIGRL